MTKMVAIEKGVPMPRLTKKPEKYPWGQMKVGDSFTVELGKSNYSGIASIASRRYAPKKFISRIVDENKRRVWRTA